MTDKTDSKEREVAEQWLRDRYGAYRGHFAWRELEEAFLAGRASLAVSAGSGPLIGQPQEMPDLSALTERGAKAWAGVDAQGLREGVASAGGEPVARADSWTNDQWIDLAQRHANADWDSDTPDGYLNAVKALCNDFAAANHSPPEGMVGGWMPIETAPKDGRFLVYVPIENHRLVIAMRGICGIFLAEDAQPVKWPPTHWMPLPPPPTTSAGSGKGE